MLIWLQIQKLKYLYSQIRNNNNSSMHNFGIVLSKPNLQNKHSLYFMRDTSMGRHFINLQFSLLSVSIIALLTLYENSIFVGKLIYCVVFIVNCINLARNWCEQSNSEYLLFFIGFRLSVNKLRKYDWFDVFDFLINYPSDKYRYFTKIRSVTIFVAYDLRALSVSSLSTTRIQILDNCNEYI